MAEIVELVASDEGDRGVGIPGFEEHIMVVFRDSREVTEDEVELLKDLFSEYYDGARVTTRQQWAGNRRADAFADFEAGLHWQMEDEGKCPTCQREVNND